VIRKTQNRVEKAGSDTAENLQGCNVNL